MRKEYKFTLDKFDTDGLFYYINTSQLGFHEIHPPRHVHSVYLDNVNFDCYNANVIGLSSRVKYRYRCYNHIRTSNNYKNKIVLESKGRINGLGFKKTWMLCSDIDISSINSHKLFCYGKNTISKPFLNAYASFNTMVCGVIYKRRYFIDASRRIRLTFDDNIQGYKPGLFPFLYPSNTMITLDYSVLEIKLSNETYNSFENFGLNKIPFTPSKHSKFMTFTKIINDL